MKNVTIVSATSILVLIVFSMGSVEVVHADVFDSQPLDFSTFDSQPLAPASFDAQPLAPSTWDSQPLAANTWDSQPIASTYDVQPIGSTYDVQPIGTGCPNGVCDIYPGDTYGTTYTPYGTGYAYSPTYGYSSSPYYGASIGAAYTPYSASYAPSNPYSAGIATPKATQSQSSYNSNPNTNTNTNAASTGPITNTNTSNSTSNPITLSNASTGAVTSTNTNTNNPVANAINGPITISNNVNVVPLSQAQPQRLVQYNIPTPSCTINVSNYYTYGNYSNQPITLTWVSSNATSAYITPNVGSVAPSGTTTVYPQGYTTYTLTVSGPGGSATCQTTANYANYAAPAYIAPAPVYVPPAPVYTQPASPSVSLTQIPYTGFDYGPVGDAIYWMSLLAFAAAGAYLVIYYRGGALAFAGSLLGSGRSAREVYSYDEVESEEAVSAPVATPAVETSALSVAPIVRSLPTIENHRITSDSMIMDRTAHGAPRIVIARS